MQIPGGDKAQGRTVLFKVSVLQVTALLNLTGNDFFRFFMPCRLLFFP
jgi:hypothetical protein